MTEDPTPGQHPTSDVARDSASSAGCEPPSDAAPQDHESGNVDLDLKITRDGKKVRVSVSQMGGPPLHVDKIDPSSQPARKRFLNQLLKKLPGLGESSLADIDKHIITHDFDTSAPPEAAGATEDTGGLRLDDHSPQNIEALKEFAACRVDRRLAALVGTTTPETRKEAIALGEDGRLLVLLADAAESLGHVGERRNSALLLLCYISSRIPDPLHAQVVGQSSSGKSHLIDNTSKLIPPELVRVFTDMTPKYFAYLDTFELACCVVVLGERELGDEEVVAVKNKLRRELISQGFITQGRVESDGKGRNVSSKRIVIGPVVTSETTTKDIIFAEDANRAIRIEVDLSEEQTIQILRRQSDKAMGKTASLQAERLHEIHSFMRMLKRPLEIRIPFAGLITTVFPTSNIEVRRVHDQLLRIIGVLAFLHQMQRKALDKEGLEIPWHDRSQRDHILIADPRDYEIAAQLVASGLMATLQMAPKESDRQLLKILQDWVRTRNQFHPERFLTPEAKQAAETAGMTIGDASAFRKRLRRLERLGIISLHEQGHSNAASTWELTIRGGEAPDATWRLPPTYAELYEAAQASDESLSPQAFQDETWAAELGKAQEDWADDKPLGVAATSDGGRHPPGALFGNVLGHADEGGYRGS